MRNNRCEPLSIDASTLVTAASWIKMSENFALRSTLCQRFLLLTAVFGSALLFGRGFFVYLTDRHYSASSDSGGNAVLSKYFSTPKNVSVEQVVYALNLEQRLLQSEITLLAAKIARQRELNERNTRKATNYRQIHSAKILPLLRSIYKFFTNLHNTVGGASMHLLSASDIGSKLTPHNFRRRQEESATINRLLAAKIAELATIHSDWRDNAASDTQEKFQTRLHKIQNPDNCITAKKLVCDIARDACGLGCQLHYGITCLAASFALNRTTILRMGHWVYTTNKWEDYFVPPSPKCQWTPIPPSPTVWRDSSHDSLNTVLYPLDIYAFQYYKPFKMERTFAELVSHFHGRPWIWWIGQLLVTLFRVQPEFEELYKKRMKILGFRSPIVGIHVRRSDKVASEAEPYELERYMEYVDEYYDKLELVQKVDQRRVFLASDAPHIYAEFRMKYPHYALVHNQAAAKSSARKNTRRSEDSLRGIMADMYFLYQSDHLVCTMSSNVCRVVYGLMQTRFADASKRYDSLDLDYIYVGANPLRYRAVHAHNATGETTLSFNVGDKMEIKKTFWNGTSSGLLITTDGAKEQRGTFPTYKVTDDLQVF